MHGVLLAVSSVDMYTLFNHAEIDIPVVGLLVLALSMGAALPGAAPCALRRPRAGEAPFHYVCGCGQVSGVRRPVVHALAGGLQRGACRSFRWPSSRCPYVGFAAAVGEHPCHIASGSNLRMWNRRSSFSRVRGVAPSRMPPVGEETPSGRSASPSSMVVVCQSGKTFSTYMPTSWSTAQRLQILV